MLKDNSDERFDAAMKSLIAYAAIDNSEINDIADSPAVWWEVKRRIAEQKSEQGFAWPPVVKSWRLLLFGVPTFAAIAILAGFFVFRPAGETTTSAVLTTAAAETRTIAAISGPVATANNVQIAQPNVDLRGKRNSDTRPTTAVYKRPVVRSTGNTAARSAEIKTEFIALSYARDAESGQIVRVKVPSSMMVTLGLVATVEKPTNLVDAEVIVGDDGLTRAIRFIR